MSRGGEDILFKCLPPGNKPTPAEVRKCNGYLAADLAQVPAGGAVLALGRIAHEATLRAFSLKPSAFAFGHGATHALERDRLLVETDAPYLAPQPFRGKRNEPAYVAHTATVLAETISVGSDEIATITTDNFFRLFSKMPRSADRDT